MDLHRSPSVRTVGAALLAVLAASSGAAAALQGAGEKVTAQRLKFERKCFYEIDSWKGKGEERFLERVEAQIPIHRAAGASKQELDELSELLGDCFYLRVKHYEQAQDKAKQSEFFAKIINIESDFGKLTDYKAEAELFLLKENLEKAKAAFSAKNHDEARRLYKELVGINKAREEAVGALVAIEMEVGGHQRAIESTDLEVVDKVFETILAGIQQSLGAAIYAEQKERNPDISRMEKKRGEIKSTTQWLSIRPFDVSGALQGVKGAKAAAGLENATFVFEPSVKGRGQRFPEAGKGEAPRDPKDKAKFKEKFLFFRGTYDVSVFLGERLVAASYQFTVEDQPMTFEFPNQIPEGMVYADKWKDGGGFFVDVTEVTCAQVEAVKGDDEALQEVVSETKGEPNEPAWFLTEKSALAFERATGKRIPTVDEWIQAARGPFAEDQRPFPWGKDAPTTEHAFVDPNAQGPRFVGGGARGRSPYGAEDMAGNMAEWVRKGDQLWLMGGYYALSGPDAVRHYDGKNPLRDPQPGKEATDAMDTAEKKTYADYKIKNDEDPVTGLRMIVPVK